MKVANVAVHSMKKDGSKVLDWLQDRRPDIVTVQKVGRERDFPTNALCEIGYKSRVLGKRSRSDLGVAILSHRNLPRPEVRIRQLPGPKQEEESRFLTVTIGDLWISSVYAPYGPTIARRIEWLNCLRNHVDNEGYSGQDSVLCGDFNVKVKADGLPVGDMYSGKEQDVLEELLGLGFVDLYRAVHPNAEEKPGCTRGYCEAYPKGTSRLHLALASRTLARCLRDVCLDVDSRPREDAPPLVVEFDGVSV